MERVVTEVSRRLTHKSALVKGKEALDKVLQLAVTDKS